MMCKDRILIIENQELQFKEIRKKLCKDFTVLPEIDDFVKVADWTRISLITRYDYANQHPGEKRKKALQKLVEYITNNKVDVIIIDHVLVGHHSGENGIHLARKLKDLNIEQPIIFLSRTERNKKSVEEDLGKEDITNSIWIEKGYAGQGIGDSWYFRKNVVEKINVCIGQSINSMLDELVESGLGSAYSEKINELRGKSFTTSQKKQLKNFCDQNLANYKEKDLLKLLKDLKDEN